MIVSGYARIAAACNPLVFRDYNFGGPISPKQMQLIIPMNNNNALAFIKLTD
jgi:hypothetical protein